MWRDPSGQSEATTKEKQAPEIRDSYSVDSLSQQSLKCSFHMIVTISEPSFRNFNDRSDRTEPALTRKPAYLDNHLNHCRIVKHYAITVVTMEI